MGGEWDEGRGVSLRLSFEYLELGRGRLLFGLGFTGHTIGVKPEGTLFVGLLDLVVSSILGCG